MPYTLLGAIVHELGHALAGKTDPKYDDVSSITDYQGTNVPFANKIWSEIKKSDAFNKSGEIGLDPMISYFGTSDKSFQRIGYDYTNKTPIDTAVNVDYLTRNKPADATTGWSTSILGMSKDLIIGGSRKNILESGAGDDFLFGGGGDDTLKGGAGKDTAIYFGNESDYDIVMHRNWLGIWDGSWDVSHARGEEVDGKDRLENIEYLRFGNGKKYELKTAGLTFQSDLALVFDTTRSMQLYGNSIDYIKKYAPDLIDAIFANNQDARVGIVAYKDAANGEPSQVILPFTDQDNFADRHSAAIAAINSLTTSGGGYDNAESGFDGLRLALNGALGQWRPAAAGNLRVVLFTDSPIKDYEIANEVSNLAHNIGATIGTSSTYANADWRSLPTPDGCLSSLWYCHQW